MSCRTAELAEAKFSNTTLDVNTNAGGFNPGISSNNVNPNETLGSARADGIIGTTNPSGNKINLPGKGKTYQL